MLDQAVRFLSQRVKARPQTAVILGSGLGGVAAGLEGTVSIPCSEIPGWPLPAAAGHEGAVRFGSLAGRSVAVVAGRVHLYEGYTAQQVVFGVRVLGRLGVRQLILTNAAGALNPSYTPGQFVLLSDHINLLGVNPLAGPESDPPGSRFTDMTEAYSARLRALAQQCARELKIELAEGVYAAVQGPSYETPAEVRYLRAIGADLVGMSTTLEVIAARRLGVEVLGISCVANLAAGVAATPLSHEEVLKTGRGAATRLSRLLSLVIAQLDSTSLGK